MKVWFTSDTHFGQERTRQLSRRPFSSVQSMDETLRVNWNTNVGPEDVVYHLGDFGKPDIVSRLTGRSIYLLVGNYDTPEVQGELLARDERISLIPGPTTTFDKLENVGLPALRLIHEPENADDPNAFYLFGHIHKLQMVKQNGLNVGVDCHDFRPIDLETVKFYYDAIMQHYDHNVFAPHLGRAFGI